MYLYIILCVVQLRARSSCFRLVQPQYIGEGRGGGGGGGGAGLQVTCHTFKGGESWGIPRFRPSYTRFSLQAPIARA